MNLYHLTMATGAVYFHRFYMFHAFQDFPRYVVATCCLFLAGKAEETPKKCKDIIKTVRSLTNDRQYATFGADPREEVMVLERVLLKVIAWYSNTCTNLFESMSIQIGINKIIASERGWGQP